jgi:hypothetical protein
MMGSLLANGSTWDDGDEWEEKTDPTFSEGRLSVDEAESLEDFVLDLVGLVGEA